MKTRVYAIAFLLVCRLAPQPRGRTDLRPTPDREMSSGSPRVYRDVVGSEPDVSQGLFRPVVAVTTL